MAFFIRDGHVYGLDRCPHCGTAQPTLPIVFPLTAVEDGRRRQGRRDLIGSPRWHVAECTSCDAPVCCLGLIDAGGDGEISVVVPRGFVVAEAVPTSAARFIQQAYETLGSPEASVVMSASAVDAMLKDQGLKNGTLYERIGQAVDKGIITENMSAWAHLVRLEANNVRHPDETLPPATKDDSERSFEFAKAISEILYVLPSRMPK